MHSSSDHRICLPLDCCLRCSSTVYNIANLLSSQLDLARTVCSETPFATILLQRLLILERIYYAFRHKYHNKDKVRSLSVIPEEDRCRDCTIVQLERASSAPNALLEMGVRTGLTLMFALIQQSWQFTIPSEGPNLSHQVLQTASDVVRMMI
ncbi:probable E3 ubiquitin-protein ligase HERC1 [Frankliniella occidentalis]|uniref:Probable E3 ubiquitin-protein ligase HERC1 n=1 Tax=Frankliniella occidentalis TaxID=133901 RepID=A0A9C6X0W4_FRAOC|nr:probable E3 ubiquitin-protein ligase HERC1 [Frankliniella occidentalis]